MFPGFALDEFDNFRPERASSNVYNRQRLAVKEKILEIIHATSSEVHGTHPDLEAGAAEHVPTLRNGRCVDAQWGYLWLSADIRRLVEEVLEGSRGVAQQIQEPPPHLRHAVLAAVLDPEGFTLAVRLSAHALLDAANLRALLGAEAGRGRMLDAMHGIPPHFRCTVPGREPVPAPEVAAEHLDAFLAAFPDDGDAWFDFGRRWNKAETAAAGSGLLARAREDLTALLPVFGLAAWSRTNDLVGLEALVQRVRAERTHEEEEHEREQRAFAERKAETRDAARERVERMFADRTPDKTRGGTREIALPPLPAWAPVGRRPRREEPAEPRREEPAGSRPAQAEPTAPPVEASPAPQRPQPARDEVHPASDHPARPAPAAQRPGGPARPAIPAPAQPAPAGPRALAPGQLVRFRQGSLRGRVGTLFEVSPKGEARVMLGLFTTRVAVEHLVEVRRRDRESERPAG